MCSELRPFPVHSINQRCELWKLQFGHFCHGLVYDREYPPCMLHGAESSLCLLWKLYFPISSTPRIPNIAVNSQSQFRLIDHQCKSYFGHFNDMPVLPSLCAGQLFPPILCLLKVPGNISQGNSVYPVLPKTVLVSYL